ncbi:MAG: LacI family DNA-binding transcriptional regulator [Silicimonas sp.]|jgi:DNA-binding LacI/PurR family transcriptional regulator|nr:LacI family DNA-binding transcriptional regulator [Silicimonas sp.]
MVRLVDVAKAAGVSRSTASNVFNNPDIVRPNLRKRVEAAANELGYAGPDPKGRLLREGKFNAIAVMPPIKTSMVDVIRNPVFNLLLQGVSEVCDERGASLVVVSGHAGRNNLGSVLADGIIFSRMDQLEEAETARLRRIPYAVVDFDPGPQVNSVRVDAKAGGYQAARHLLELGHRKFAILSFLREGRGSNVIETGSTRLPESAGIATDQEKLMGYANALSEAGIDIGAVPMVQADANDPEAAGKLLDIAPEATAVLSMSVMQGIRVIGEAISRGLRVPQDLSVVGFNDIPAAEHSVPSLTTVDGMGVQKGRDAACQILDGGPPRHKIIQPVLKVRGSSGPAPA